MDCSDKTRRTLGEALQTGKFSDAALAFVNGAGENSSAVKAVAVASELPATINDSRPADNFSRPKSNGVQLTSQAEDRAPISGTVSMTFRLPAELSARLVRVSVERKLQRQRPFSQQDIIAEALARWFERNC